MNKPHVHAELIKAWADGATIQYESAVLGEWRDTDQNRPQWQAGTKYRIKPEPVEDIVCDLHVAVAITGNLIVDNRGEGCNLRLFFDGETKQLKKAEVL